MVTTRASAIRFGVSKSWPVKSASLGFFDSNFEVKIRNFFSNFFSQPLVIGAGIALAGVLVHRFSNKFILEIFLQDSRLLDWLATRPGFFLARRITTGKKKIKKYYFAKKTLRKFRCFSFASFAKNYKASSAPTKLTLRRTLRRMRRMRYMRRRRHFFSLRRFRLQNRYFAIRSLARFRRRTLRLRFRRIFRKLKFKRQVRRKAVKLHKYTSGKFKKFKKFKKSNRDNFRGRRSRAPRRRFFAKSIFRFKRRFFYRYTQFSRLRLFAFLARMASLTGFVRLGVPIFFRINFIGRISPAQLQLNYITTKLYYRYILNDVIKPIVRMSLRYYRGFRIVCRGRFTRAQMASERVYRRGSLRLSTMSVPVDYAQKSVVLKYGVCNLKIWLRY
jgi:hypothetical protein